MHAVSEFSSTSLSEQVYFARRIEASTIQMSQYVNINKSAHASQHTQDQDAKFIENISILVLRTILMVYLIVVELCVIDGQQLGTRAPGVVAVAHRNGAEEDAEPEQRPVRDPESCARQPHGVQMQHGTTEPRTDGALSVAQLHGVLPLAARRRYAEEGSNRAEAHLQALRARCGHDIRHGRVRRLGGRRSHQSGGAGEWWGEWARLQWER